MITIFTPTYNRAKYIHRTYESLCSQTCKDFEWLVVDDGSTDNTELLFDRWTKEASFPIRYIKKDNGGKYRAYNVGLREAKSELFFCVDSDDWLPQDSIERIMSYRDQLMQAPKLAGIIALKEYPDHHFIGRAYATGLGQHSLYMLETMGERGERSLVFKTAIAQQYPFPEINDEKFMTESVIYDRMEQYLFIVSNDVLTTCEYQQDGLSSNVRGLMLHNPSTYKLYFAQRIDLTPNLKERFTYALRYHAFRKICHHRYFQYSGPHKALVVCASFFTPLMVYYYKR